MQTVTHAFVDNFSLLHRSELPLPLIVARLGRLAKSTSESAALDPLLPPLCRENRSLYFARRLSSSDGSVAASWSTSMCSISAAFASNAGITLPNSVDPMGSGLAGRSPSGDAFASFWVKEDGDRLKAVENESDEEGFAEPDVGGTRKETDFEESPEPEPGVDMYL